MTVSKKEIEDALSILKANGGSAKAEKLCGALSYIIDGMGGREHADIIDRDAYIASVLWHRKDIEEALDERGLEPADENVGKAIGALDTGMLEDCSDGWDAIYDAVDSAFGL